MDFKKKLKIAGYVAKTLGALENVADSGVVKSLKSAAETGFAAITNEDTLKNIDGYVSKGMEYAEIGAKNAAGVVNGVLNKSDAYGIVKKKALLAKKKLDL